MLTEKEVNDLECKYNLYAEGETKEDVYSLIRHVRETWEVMEQAMVLIKTLQALNEKRR